MIGLFFFFCLQPFPFFRACGQRLEHGAPHSGFLQHTHALYGGSCRRTYHVFQFARMHSRLQHHLRASQNRLGRKSVSLFPGHSLRYSSVRHRFDKHEHIGRRTAADSSRRIHQPLGDELCSTETVSKFTDLARVLLRHLLVDAHACHSFPYLRRGAGQLLLVAVNLSGETAEFALPVAFAGTRPLLATQGAPRPGVLRPWEGLIYCRDL